jgi:hypothetical protein
LGELARVQTEGAMPLVLRGINDFLSNNKTRNKSGALLLTIARFTMTVRPARQRIVYRPGRESASSSRGNAFAALLLKF